ncbi:Hpt domain-containing protein [Actinoplanes subglobosus]|uniref:Hpt domain-containing protein n=1 Tax=Actinoplanes subglobosus TaxID=1547892 RepID=A0ABV8J6Q2_9ACTN
MQAPTRPDPRWRPARLKGSASNIGADRLVNLGADVEGKARAGHLPDPAATVHAIRDEFQTIAPTCADITEGLHPTHH